MIPAGHRRIERVAGGAEQPVDGVGADAEFGNVGFADDHPTGGTDPGHDPGVGIGHVVGELRATEGGSDAGRGLQILDGHGQGEQRPIGQGGRTAHRSGPVAAQLPIEICRLLDGALGGDGDHGVDLGIDTLHLIQAGGDQLLGRQFTAGHGGSSGTSRQAVGFAHHSVLARNPTAGSGQRPLTDQCQGSDGRFLNP